MIKEQISNLNDRVQGLMKAGELDEAVKLLETDIDLVNQDFVLMWSLGWAYFQLSNYEAAINCLLRATELSPTSPVSYWALGTACLKAKRYEEAETHLTEALRIKDAYIARITLALTYLEQGKIMEAEAIHVEGIKLRPNDRERLEAYADFLSDVGREKEADQMHVKAGKLPHNLGNVGNV